MIALVATALYTWTMATAYTDGTPLAIEDISATLVQWGTCGTGGVFGAELGSTSVAAPLTTYTVALSPGTAYCSQLFTVLDDGRQSAASAAVRHVEVAGVDPNAPTFRGGVVAGRDTYQLVTTEDGYMDFVVSGRAQRGAQCRMLPNLAIWGPYGYGIAGIDFVICEER